LVILVKILLVTNVNKQSVANTRYVLLLFFLASSSSRQYWSWTSVIHFYLKRKSHGQTR